METYQSQPSQSEARQRVSKSLPTEAMESFESFSEKKKAAILSLSEEDLGKWATLFSKILKANKNYRKLDDALYADKIPDEDLAKANATLLELKKVILALEKEENDLIYGSTGNGSGGTGVVNPKYDRTARSGVLSIRPTNKRKENRYTLK